MQRLHKYKILFEDNGGIDEVCTRCGKRLVTLKGKDGSIDNIKYGKEHMRDFLQPNDPLFEREFGKPIDINKPHND